MTAAVPTLGVSIATIGRWDAVHALLDCLDAQTVAPDRIVLVAQNHDLPENLTARIAGRAASMPPVEIVLDHGRGSSHGRNVGARALVDRVDYIWFPNDTTTVEPDFVERCLARLVASERPTMLVTSMRDSEGERVVVPPRGTPVGRRSVWGAIECAMIIDGRAFVEVGGFDELMGTGSPSPWQSGESVQLVFTMQRDLPQLRVEWAPDIHIGAVLEFAGLSAEERHWKLRTYSRGAANIYRIWRFPPAVALRFLVGGATLGLRRRDKYTIADGYHSVLGRIEGLRGRPFANADRDRPAVTR